MGLSDNSIGLILAVASSAFIGSSFILKKKGLKRAGSSGTRAGQQLHTFNNFMISSVFSVKSLLVNDLVF